MTFSTGRQHRFVTAGGLEIEITMDGIIDKDGRETEIRFGNGTLVAKDNVITLKSTDGTVLREEDFRRTCALPLHAGADIDIVEDFAMLSGRGRRRNARCGRLFPD